MKVTLWITTLAILGIASVSIASTDSTGVRLESIQHQVQKIAGLSESACSTLNGIDKTTVSLGVSCSTVAAQLESSDSGLVVAKIAEGPLRVDVFKYRGNEPTWFGFVLTVFSIFVTLFWNVGSKKEHRILEYRMRNPSLASFVAIIIFYQNAWATDLFLRDSRSIVLVMNISIFIVLLCLGWLVYKLIEGIIEGLASLPPPRRFDDDEE